MKNKKEPMAEQLKTGILDELSATEAFLILKILADENENIRERILQIAKEHLGDIDIEAVASEIYSELESIDVEDLWENSGATQYDYVEPTEVAWEIVENTVRPFIENLNRYRRLFLKEKSKIYCKGLLKGLYKFDKEAKTQFKDWATDAPMEYFGIVLEEWKKWEKSKKEIGEIELFVKENFPDRK